MPSIEVTEKGGGAWRERAACMLGPATGACHRAGCAPSRGPRGSEPSARSPAGRQAAGRLQPHLSIRWFGTGPCGVGALCSTPRLSTPCPPSTLACKNQARHPLIMMERYAPHPQPRTAGDPGTFPAGWAPDASAARRQPAAQEACPLAVLWHHGESLEAARRARLHACFLAVIIASVRSQAELEISWALWTYQCAVIGDVE
jgi:hypothetical protein